MLIIYLNINFEVSNIINKENYYVVILNIKKNIYIFNFGKLKKKIKFIFLYFFFKKINVDKYTINIYYNLVFFIINIMLKKKI